MKVLSESCVKTAVGCAFGRGCAFGPGCASGRGCASARWLPVVSRCLLLAVPWLALTAAFVGQENNGGAQSPIDDRPAVSPPVAQESDDHAQDRPEKVPDAKGSAPNDPVPELPGSGTSPADTAQGTALLPKGYACLVCHSTSGELWTKDVPVVTEKDLAGDVHWQAGVRCHECHGGTADMDNHDDHRKDGSFRSIDREDIPALCGRCHEKKNPDVYAKYAKSVHFGSGGEVGASCSDCHGSHGMFPATDERSKLHPVQVVHTCGDCHANIEYMRKFRPSPRTDQLAEYLTSGHGLKLLDAEAPDIEVATCVSCHCREEHTAHAIRPAGDMASPVYPTNLAETCNTCHGDQRKMAGRQYHGKELGYDQYDHWKESVHAKALLEKGDLSAPTCNDCHGNHGAVPPDIDSVANACGTCHAKVAGLFENTRMKHRFEQEDWEGLPGCTACHSNHHIHSPTDEMLGTESDAVCIECHQKENQYGAPLAGIQTASELRAGLDQLNRQIMEAKATIEQAERLGMEVRGPRFDLMQAENALTNARSLIHTFSAEPVEEALAEGRTVAEEVIRQAEDALAEHTNRRIWLALSLVPILIVVVLLLLYIRTLPIPGK